VITELRRYRIIPERLDSWLAFFATAVGEHELVVAADVRTALGGPIAWSPHRG
jgi:hypothetical protein